LSLIFVSAGSVICEDFVAVGSWTHWK